MNHDQPYRTAVMHQFCPDRVSESPYRVFGATIDRLQWDRSIGKGRADIYDRTPVALPHALQRRHCAVDLPEIGHCRRAAEFLGGDAVDRSEDGRHCVVDPDIDRTQFPFDTARCSLDRFGLSHIGDDRKRALTP